jgi:hypothetical protein
MQAEADTRLTTKKRLRLTREGGELTIRLVSRSKSSGAPVRKEEVRAKHSGLARGAELQERLLIVETVDVPMPLKGRQPSRPEAREGPSVPPLGSGG